MVWRQLGRSVLMGVLGSLGSAAVLPGSLLASTLTVTDCGDTVPGGEPGQLRRLIADAAPGDVIVVPACTVQLTGAAHLEITKSLTIRGTGAGRTVILGSTTPTLEQGGRVFEILFGVGPVEISDLTVAAGNPSVGTGGGISNIGVLTLARVAVTGNLSRAAGGGISNHWILTIRDSLVGFNAAPNGGGIWNSDRLTLANTTVSDNVAVAMGQFPSPATGAGIENLRTLVATNVTIAGNRAIGIEVVRPVSQVVAAARSGTRSSPRTWPPLMKIYRPFRATAASIRAVIGFS